MKNLTVLSAGMAAGILLFTSVVVGAPDGPEIGSQAPDLTLTDTDGKTIKLADFRATVGDGGETRPGKVLVVVFWSYKCPTGDRYMARMGELAEWCKQKGAIFVAVDSYGETAEQTKAYRENKKLEYPIYMDEPQEVARAFGARNVTATYVIDAEGRLSYAGGFDDGSGKDDREQYARDAARQVLAGEKVAVPMTKAKG